MASHTPNYNLKKPAPTDFYNIADHNANMDKVDDALGQMETQIGGIDTTSIGAANVNLSNVSAANFANKASTSNIAPAIGRSYATSTTPAGSTVKVAASAGFVRSTGAVVGVKFSYANTAINPSLNVNGTGSAAIYNGLTDERPVEGEMTAGTHFFMFNGSQWVLLNPYSRGGMSAELRVHVAVNTTAAITVTVRKGSDGLTQTVNASAEWAIFPIDELGDWEVTLQYGANTYTQNVAVENIGIHYANPAPLVQLSWDRIIWIARAGLAPRLFKLGDTANVTISSVARGFRIIGFNHDNLADNSGKAPITFYGTVGYFGVDHSGAQSWVDSRGRTTLNSTGYNAFPSNVRAAITPVLKRSGQRSSFPAVTTDHLFLPSEIEMYGGYLHAPADEGFQYEHFAQGNIPASTWHWLRSIARDRADYFVTMESVGTPGTQESYRGTSTPFAFCIG